MTNRHNYMKNKPKKIKYQKNNLQHYNINKNNMQLHSMTEINNNYTIYDEYHPDNTGAQKMVV